MLYLGQSQKHACSCAATALSKESVAGVGVILLNGQNTDDAKGCNNRRKPAAASRNP